MTKFKTTHKITLALLTILQLGTQIKASEAVVIDLPPLEHALEEIGEVFGVIKIIDEIKAKFNIVFKERFRDRTNYPNMSLSDLGDEIIAIVDNAHELPDDIRQNLIKLVNIKKMSGGVIELLAPHPLISEILIQLAKFKQDKIKEGMPVLVKHFNIQDIAKINQELVAYRNSVEKLKTRGKYKSISDINPDLKKILDKIKVILKDHRLYLSFINRSANGEDDSLSTMELAALFNYRIAQNKPK